MPNHEAHATLLSLAGNPLTADIESLVSTHYAYVRRLALSILDDPDEADDAAQEAFIAAHQPHCPVSDNLYWTWTQQANRRLLLEMMASGKLHVAEMLTHRFPAQQAPQVYEHIKTGDRSMLGVLLEWV